MEKKNISLNNLPLPKITPLQIPKKDVIKTVKSKSHLDGYYAKAFIESYFS